MPSFVTLITLFGGYLVKIYAWKSILGREGILNGVLLWMGVVDQSLSVLIYSSYAVSSRWSIFAAIRDPTIYGAALDLRRLIEAARDLGSTPLQAARDIVASQCNVE